MRKAVLVVGDLAVDRNWLISEPVAEERYAPYDNVAPRNLIDPKRYTDVAGGIGTIARALGSIPERKVYAAGAWNNETDGRLKDLLPPEAGDDGAKRKADVTFIRLASPRFTLLRHRLYTPQANGTKLLHRFDRDPEVTAADRFRFDKLPPRREVAMVILGDYNGALLKVPKVIEAIRERYTGLPMIVRSASDEVIKSYPWTILTLNVHSAARFAGLERFDEPILRQLPPSHCLWHPTLVRALHEIARKADLHDKRAFVLNMEADGVLVLQGGVMRPLMLSTPDALRSLAVGGNDVMLAWLAHHYLRTEPQELGVRLAEACRKALPAAYVFSSRSKNLESIANYYAPCVAVSDDDLKGAPPLVTYGEAKLPEIEELETASSVGAILGTDATLPDDAAIHLHDARWYLDDFLTIDDSFGGNLIRLKQRLREYVRKPGPRPFVTALCGEPGAGKSTLAEKLAQAAGVMPIFENVAQWDSLEDLAHVCERVRTAQMRHERPLVFLDEVDTKINDGFIFGKLLAPVWDGSYSTHGEVRTIGTPTIFLLAGSTQSWRTPEALYETARGGEVPKLDDLVSRFTFPAIGVPALHLRKQDIAYMVVFNIKRRFPRVEEVQEGIFRLIAQSTCRYGARSVARVIEQLKPPKEKTVFNDDLEIGEDLSMFLEHPPEGWRNKKKLVKISP